MSIMVFCTFTIHNIIMSYNTTPILVKHGLSQEQFLALPEAEQKKLMWEALNNELPLGMTFIQNAVNRFKKGERDTDVKNRLIASEDPNSLTGKQVIRLLFDMPRKLIVDHYGVTIGGYNCCGLVIADDEDGLQMSIAEQFLMQSTPDC